LTVVVVVVALPSSAGYWTVPPRSASALRYVIGLQSRCHHSFLVRFKRLWAGICVGPLTSEIAVGHDYLMADSLSNFGAEWQYELF